MISTAWQQGVGSNSMLEPREGSRDKVLGGVGVRKFKGCKICLLVYFSGVVFSNVCSRYTLGVSFLAKLIPG